MKWSIIFILCVVHLLDLKAIAGEGGWGSSGGGSGIACFDSELFAAKADANINSNAPIPNHLRNHILMVKTLDYWEWEQTKPFEIFKPRSENYQDILNEVYERISRIVPLYIYRLKQAASSIQISDWKNKQDIPRIYDSKPVGKIPPNCRLIQLVARYSNGNNKIGEGPVKHKPAVKIDFDQDYFNRLDSLNRAVLEVHEQMYFLGQSIGHQNSDTIRPLVMRFFENNLHQPAPWVSPNGLVPFKMNYLLIHFFGDYVMLFGKDQKLEAMSLTQESRFNSFYEILEIVREKIAQCLKRENIKDPSQPENFKRARGCQAGAMDPVENQKWMNEEQAFVFLTYFNFGILHGRLNGELVLAPIKTPDFIEISNSTLKMACINILMDSYNFIAQDMVAKAIWYCGKINPTPTGKGQN